MAILGWQTLSIAGIGPAIRMMLNGNIINGMTSNPAAMLILWAIVGAVIFFGYRLYLRSRGIEFDDRQVMQQLYASPAAKNER